MGKKKGKGGDVPAPKPKRLSKQLRRAEADLAKAVAKRDKAQARVEAMAIIADEVRAQLAERDKAAAKAAKAAKAEAASKDAADVKTTGATSKASGARPKPTATAAAPKRKTTARKTTARTTTAASSRAATSKSATSKKAPSTKPAQPRSRARKSPPKS